MFPCTCCVSRYRFPDEDFNSGLNHHHPAALGYCRTGEVRCNTAYSHVYHPYILHVLYAYLISSHSFHPCLFRFRSITEQYYRKADGILAMYDITHSSSFTAVRGWLDSVKVSRWRWHRWFDVKTCKTVCLNLNTHAGNWEHSAIRISIATNAMGVINLNFLFFWGYFCCVMLSSPLIYFLLQFSTLVRVCILTCVCLCFFQEKMSEGAVLMLLANKLDLADSHSRKVTAAEGQRLAEVRHNWIFKLRSALIYS